MSENNLTFKGKLTEVQPVQEGVSNSGNAWKKVDFLVEEDGAQYPQSAAFTLFGGEKVDKFMQYNKVGDEVEVSFNVKSRKYTDRNGVDRYGVELGAWRVSKLQGAATQQQSPVPAPVQDDFADDEDDLPF